MFPVLFHLGSFEVHSYGVLYLVAYVTAGSLAGWEARRLGHSPFIVLGAIVVGVTGAVVCGRLLAFALAVALGSSPAASDLFRAGTTYLGAILGLVAGVVLYTLALRAWRPASPGVLRTLDILCTVAPLGHGIGRVGCFLAGCCYGTPTTSVLGVTYSTPGIGAPRGVPLHPTQLYETAGELLLFAVLWALRTRKRFAGQLMLSYLVGYGVLRFALEFFRGDARPAALGLSAAQWFCLPMAALAALAMGLLWVFVLRERGSRPAA